MSEPEDTSENFLQRWSRRKHDAETRAPNDADRAPAQRADAAANAPESTVAKVESDAPAFDPKTLPPIESINAASDVRAFLAPGVPDDIMRAALRRAWVTDPTIRDFVGIAENQWDFTDPENVPGFGSLEFTDDVRRMVAALVGGAPDQQGLSAPPAQVAQDAEKPDETALSGRAAPPDERNPDATIAHKEADPVAAADTAEAASGVNAQFIDRNGAVQNNGDEVGPHRQAAHRKHGSAVPK